MRRRAPRFDPSVEIPRWVLRLWAEDIDRFATVDPEPDEEFLERHGAGAAEAWQWHRYNTARHAWRDAADAWWREHAPTHPRAPWWIRRAA